MKIICLLALISAIFCPPKHVPQEPVVTGVEIVPNPGSKTPTYRLTGPYIDVSVVGTAGEVFRKQVSRNFTVRDLKRELAESRVVDPSLMEFNHLFLDKRQLPDTEILSLLQLADGTFVSLSNKTLVLNLETWDPVD